MPDMSPQLLQLINKIMSEYSHCFHRNAKKTQKSDKWLPQNSFPLIKDQVNC